MNNSNPVTLYEYSFSFLNIVKFNYILEDRRPDLTIDEAVDQLLYKFKHQFNFKFIFSKSISLICHSLSTGIVYEDGEDILYIQGEINNEVRDTN